MQAPSPVIRSIAHDGPSGWDGPEAELAGRLAAAHANGRAADELRWVRRGEYSTMAGGGG